jgi:hypothetical protein
VAGEISTMRIEARYYETYELCGIVDQVLRDPYDFAAGLEALTCDDGWVDLTEPFQKFSALHKFIEHVVRAVHQEQLDAFSLVDRQRDLERFHDAPDVL